MVSLEIKPEEVKAIDRDAHTRLTTRTRPTDTIPVLKAILMELECLNNRVSDAISHVSQALRSLEIDNLNIVITDVQKVVAAHFNVSRLDLVSHRRTQDVVRPRHIAMYLCRNLTTRSMPEISRCFSKRDHTTVMHAIRSVNEMMKNPAFAEEIRYLTDRIITGTHNQED